MTTGTMNRHRGRIGGSLVVFLLLMFVASSGVVNAQDDDALDATGETAGLSNATAIALDLNVTEITDPGSFWLDEAGFHARGLTGIDEVSGDLTGAATTRTAIDWEGPCNTTSLICLGAQTSFTQLTITDDHGTWAGLLHLIVDHANDEVSVTAVLIGRGRNAGQALYLNEVTDRDDVSLSLSGYQLGRARSIGNGGVHLQFTACVVDEATANGGFQGHYAVEDGGSLELLLTSQTDTSLARTVEATFRGARGTLTGSAVEMATSDGGSAGSFVLLGVDGDYDGYVGIGRTGSDLVESSLCFSGYEIHSFWTGEVYRGD